MSDTQTTVLYRPVSKDELALIRESGNTRFPPRLPEQPIFYPGLNEEYATRIAGDWNAKQNRDRVGYVTRLRVRTDFLRRYEVPVVGGSEHREQWIPAEEPEEFNRNLVGENEVIAEYRGAAQGGDASNNGMHPTRDTTALMFLQTLGRAGDAGRQISSCWVRI